MTTVKLEKLQNMSVFFYGKIKEGGFLRIKQIFRTKLEWFLKFKQRKKLQPKSTQLLMGKFKFVFQRWEVVHLCNFLHVWFDFLSNRNFVKFTIFNEP